MADKIYDLIKNENQPIEILEIVKKKFVENER